MSDSMKSLKASLDEFNQTLMLITKIIDRDQIEDDKDKLAQSFKAIAKIMSQSDYSRQQKLRIQKFQKDYASRLKEYYRALQKYENIKNQEIMTLRRSISIASGQPTNQYETTGRYGNNNKSPNNKYNSKPTKKRNQSSDEESQKQEQKPAFKMHEVNQQTLHMANMVELKEKELLQIKAKMEQALEVQKNIQTLVIEQGAQLNVAEDNIDSARSNVKEGQQNLIQAKEHHIAANKKMWCIIGVVVVVVLIIVVPILVKFL